MVNFTENSNTCPLYAFTFTMLILLITLQNTQNTFCSFIYTFQSHYIIPNFQWVLLVSSVHYIYCHVHNADICCYPAESLTFSLFSSHTCWISTIKSLFHSKLQGIFSK